MGSKGVILLLILAFSTIAIAQFQLLSCQPTKTKHNFYIDSGVCSATFDSVPPIINVQGSNFKIQGKYMDSLYTPQRVEAYQGIRFGSAERFKRAVVENFVEDNKTLCANHVGDKCPQSPYAGGADCGGREDCLFLNVYRPTGTADDADLPVMVFVHGGSFTSGDASVYMPTKLLEGHDVILVVIQYRLGAFGFYTLSTSDTYGNYALYDQITALEWVQANIGYFGGDQNRVTLFGESAGSTSVTWQILSPLTNGLISSVIAESGSSLEAWGIDKDPDYAAEYISEECGCLQNNDFDDDKHEIYLCMLDCPVETLRTAESHLVHDDREMGLMGFRGAAPSVQSNLTVPPEEIVIDRPAIQYLQDGEFNPVPFMIGANKQEGSYVVGTLTHDYLMPNEKNATYLREESINDLLFAIGIDDQPHSVSNSLQMEYCPGIDLGDIDASYPCFVDLCSVLFLKAGGWEMCNAMSYHDKAPVYYYSFDFESDDSMYIWLIGYNDRFDPGITHSDELMYLFALPAIMEGKQIDVMNRMTTMWTNFAAYGEPTPDEETNWVDLEIPKFTPYIFEDHHYMLMRDEFTLEKEYTARWTITVDELTTPTTTETMTSDNVNSSSMGTTKSTMEYTSVSSDSTMTSDCGYCPEDYEKLQDQREAYMITMIVFIILFIIATASAFYFFFKTRN